MPTLRELDAHFKRYAIGIADEGHGRKLPDGTTQWGGFEVDTFATVETIAEAQGVWFDCPACWMKWKAGGKYGPHGVLVWWSPEVPGRIRLDSNGNAVLWSLDPRSTSLDNLILTPSIALNSGVRGEGVCQWHGFVGSNGVPPGHAA